MLRAVRIGLKSAKKNIVQTVFDGILNLDWNTKLH